MEHLRKKHWKLYYSNPDQEKLELGLLNFAWSIWIGFYFTWKLKGQKQINTVHTVNNVNTVYTLGYS